MMLCAFRQKCKKCRMTMEETQLLPFLKLLGHFLAVYQRSVKETKCLYLSGFVWNSSHYPRVLFNTINTVVNPVTCVLPDATTTNCENVLHVCADKMASVRQVTFYCSSWIICCSWSFSCVWTLWTSCSHFLLMMFNAWRSLTALWTFFHPSF